MSGPSILDTIWCSPQLAPRHWSSSSNISRMWRSWTCASPIPTGSIFFTPATSSNPSASTSSARGSMPSHDGVSLLEARGLQRSFGQARILRGLDLSLSPGEALAVIGPNGAGKTTLLRLLAGLLRPTAGEIRVLGHRLGRGSDGPRGAVGLLSHQSLLYDDLTLRENLAFAARLYSLDQPNRVADTALEAAGLSNRA